MSLSAVASAGQLARAFITNADVRLLESNNTRGLNGGGGGSQMRKTYLCLYSTLNPTKQLTQTREQTKNKNGHK